MKYLWSGLFGLCFAVLCAADLHAQKGYEFEVYSVGISPRGAGVLELHTNFVTAPAEASGAGFVPIKHAFRTALEVSSGLNSWLEGSVYFVGYAHSSRGFQYVGNRARLTAILPRSANWPAKLGLSQEVGFARRGFAENRWAYELSPIIEVGFGGFTLVGNPAFERGLDESSNRVEFEPRVKLGRAIGDDASIFVEYYGGIGPVLAAEPISEQHHQVFASVESEISKRWEVSLGIGRGFTQSSDRGVIVTKLEYQFGK